MSASLEYPISLGKDLLLRPVEPADVEVSHLLNLGDPVRHDVYAWRYFDNPAREGRPAGWVVVHGQHGVVGKIWLTWTRARLRGDPILATLSGDLYVDPRLRGMGAGVALVRHQFESFADGLVLGSSANVNSNGLWVKFGGFAIPGGELRFQRLLTPSGALKAAASLMPPVRRAVKRFFSGSSEVEALPTESPPGASWRAADLGDPALLEFLDGVERSVDITVRRDETFLRWRYERGPVHRPEALVVSEGSRILAFLAMQVRHRQYLSNARLAEVIDFMLDFDDPSARAAVVAASLQWARARRADLLEWRGTHPSLPGLFPGRGWIRRRDRINPFVCYSGRIDELELRSRSFHLVLADGDIALL